VRETNIKSLYGRLIRLVHREDVSQNKIILERWDDELLLFYVPSHYRMLPISSLADVELASRVVSLSRIQIPKITEVYFVEWFMCLKWWTLASWMSITFTPRLSAPAADNHVITT
jgi:hypothetical protein